MRNANVTIAALVAGAAGVHCAPEDTIALNADMDSCLAVEFKVTEQTTAVFEDTTVDWSGLTADLYGNPMDPATEVEAVALYGYVALTHDDVVFELNCGALMQTDIAWFSRYYPQQSETAAQLGDFDDFDPSDNRFDMDPENHFVERTWGLAILRDNGWEALAFALVTSTSSAPVQTIEINTESASLVIHRDGEGAPIPRVTSPEVWLDWTVWAENDGGGSCGVCPGGGGSGEPDIELIRLARYDSDVAQPDLDMITHDALAADVVYEAEHPVVDGMRYELTSLQTEDGVEFSGFDEDGIWMLGLFGEHRTFWTPYFLGRID
jgi:hypothetical protein